MAALDIEKFRQAFEAFKDPTKYPDAAIEFYWNMATAFISENDCPCRTLNGKALQAALDLLTAHLMFLAKQAARPVGGQARAGSGGFTTSASIGDVSVSKLAPPASNAWQWWLSGSAYGQQLWAMLSLLSAGGFAIGGLPEREAFRKVGGVFF